MDLDFKYALISFFRFFCLWASQISIVQMLVTEVSQLDAAKTHAGENAPAVRKKTTNKLQINLLMKPHLILKFRIHQIHWQA